MRGGQLRNRAHIQQDTSNDDTPTPDFSGTPFKANWPCAIQPVGGDESYRGRQLEAHVDYVVSGRYVSGVTSMMRLSVQKGLYDGKTLNIEQVRETQDKSGKPYLELYCTELAS